VGTALRVKDSVWPNDSSCFREVRVYDRSAMTIGVTEQELIQWFADKAYEPMWVYLTVVGLMFISSFGFPLPEEVTLVASGLVAHIAHNPENYPVPEGAGPNAVNMWVLAAVAFFAVLSSDLLVYFIGKFIGKRFRGNPRFEKWHQSKSFQKAEAWTAKYGSWASGIFRFTPGLRFPGHMACGLLGVPTWKFIAVDGAAALLTVPTQIILLGIYGDVILENFKVVKIVILAVLAIFVLWLLIKKLPQLRRRDS
jgi:membrane protein DedA with SNARE-associated domain